MNLSRGFTLVELLVTIAIIAVVASVAVPSVQEALATQRIKSAAHNLSNTFAEARYQAAMQRLSVDVVSSGSGVFWKASTASSNGAVQWYVAPSTDSNNRIMETAVDHRVSIRTDLSSEAEMKIRFLPNGNIALADESSAPLAGTTVFRICDTGVPNHDGYTVTLNSFGSSRVMIGKVAGLGSVGASSCT
ncbi:MAG: GspH/FimT family pseudopilin [Pseudomonadota bacterium]|nr:GspH/FimT family pseudopilin [Pseudomonadota bacterium]